jgi:uncharacterized heparinase superfamily protein
MSPPPLAPLSNTGRTLSVWSRNASRLVHRYGQAEWFGSPFHLLSLRGPRTSGAAATPRDLRPAHPQKGAQLMAGTIILAGQTMQVGPGGDPFDKPSPSRAFAEALHEFGWLGDMVSVGDRGEREALRLILDWRRVFGRWNSFSWSERRLDRRVFNLACALRRVVSHASDLENQQLCESLARQARQLLKISAGPAHAAERAVAAALAGTALAGEAGERLMVQALARLQHALPETVLPDGGHASRSPQAGLELLLDLMALDDGLSQRGRSQPDAMGRAIDRLSSALRFYTLPDGRLPCFQGGEAAHAEDIAAARAASDLPEGLPSGSLPHAGYQRMAGKLLTVVADGAGPATGAWSEAATAQPLALEIFSGPDRLITNCGWSPIAQGPQAHRLTSAGSTLTVGDGSVGEPVGGRLGRLLGARLKDGARHVEAKRHEAPQGTWLELAHDGWTPAWGLKHERLLYLDRSLDELRGEERLVPQAGNGSGRVAPITLRFHLAPQVRASLARDQRSVLIQGPTTAAWWLRNDASEVAIEHSVHYDDGLPHRSTQIVLRSQMPVSAGGRIRWKMAQVEPQGAG